MAFSETTVLSTREPSYGARVLGQVIVVPSGRLDKVALYLEPVVDDPVAAQSISVLVEIYALDSNNLPVGAPLASDYKALSDMAYRGLYNFRTEANTPTTIGLVLRVPAGNASNYVAWRFVNASGEPMLISDDGGSSWTKDPTRKFSFFAYSLTSLPDGTPGAIDEDEQTATLQPGRDTTIEDDTAAQWSLGTLDRTAIDGDTVVIDFGDYAITMVVDHSGSMTWNDNDGLRFDFLEAFIDDLESSLAPHPQSDATYSIVKFHGRQIGRLSLSLESGSSTSLPVGSRLLRKQGSPITGPTDGVVLYEGTAEGYSDLTTADGGTYYYGVYAYDAAGNFSSGFTTMVTTVDGFVYPVGGAGLVTTSVIQERTLPDAGCPTGAAGTYDLGERYVTLEWRDPASDDLALDYDGFCVIRRTDRYAESIFDGTPMRLSSYGGYRTLVPDSAPSTIPKDVSGTYSFRDFYDATAAPTEHLSPILGLTYYYTIFTYKGSLGGSVSPDNAVKDSAAIQSVDRFWEELEFPLNDPSQYCFDVTPPSPPTASVIIGNEELEIRWVAGDATSVRYKLYYDPESSPEIKADIDGQTTITGTLLYDGEDTSYIHRNLDNDEPHFYLLVALDRLENMSSAVTFVARPTEIDPSSDSIPPAPPIEFRNRIASGRRVDLSWRLAIEEERSLSVWFGDTVTATLSVSFSDLNSRTSLATLEFDEIKRTINAKEGEEVDEQDAIEFASIPQSETNSLVSTIDATPSMFVRNKMEDASLEFRGALRVEEAATGKLFSQVLTPSATVRLANPLDLAIEVDPTQKVNRTSWTLACSLDDAPEKKIEQFPGVYVRTGESLDMEIEAKYRDAYIPSSLPVRVRILDVDTGEPSSTVRLPQTNSDGVAILNLVPSTDESLDRTGNPSGTTVTRSLLSLSIPPQDFPGDFIIEASVEYRGYEETVTEEVHFESSLNIDIEAQDFTPDGISIAEQSAFVYYGDPLESRASKSPVPDQTVVTWELVRIQSQKPRSLYSTDNVPGTGVKSYVRSGIARKVFFGPASDVEPPSSPTCTDGELWALKCTVEVAGLEKVEYAKIELNPFEPPPLLNRIFLKANGAFNKAELMADGETEATFVVVAKPELDGDPADPQSGAYFRDRIVALGGSVPSLDDGNLVTLYVTTRHGSVSPYDVIITTNISPNGQPMMAQARIENGVAEFKLKVNASVYGSSPDAPLTTEYNNLIYDQDLAWPQSPDVFALVAMIPLEVNGKQISFTGGGQSLTSSTPPVFLGLIEPLAPGSISG